MMIRVRGWVDEPSSRNYILQLHSALSYCIANYVDHRDIRSCNILIDTKTLTLKLINFHHSKPINNYSGPYNDDNTDKMSLPVEWFNRGVYEPLMGLVWSIGCILFELVTGSKPFNCVEDIMNYNVCLGEEKVAISEECLGVMLGCLNPVPRHRTSFTKILCLPWFTEACEDSHFI